MEFGDTTALEKIEAIKARIGVIQGGARAGKTIATLITLCDLSFDVKDKIISVVTDSYPNLEKGAMRDWQKLLVGTNRKGYFRVNQAKHTWTNLVTGTVVEFFSCDAEDALGAGRDYLFVNEANRISFDTFSQLELRTTERIWLDFNPVNEFWAHTEVLKKRTDAEFLKLTYKDNEEIPDNVLKSLLQRKGDGTNNWWRVYGMGEIGSLEGNVYSGWISADEYDGKLDLVRYGLDFGFTNDETGMVAVYKTEDGGYLLKELVYETGLLGSQYPERLERAGVEHNVLIIADSARPETIAEIKKAGFRCIGAEKGAGSVLKGIDYVSQSKIYFEGKNLEREYLTYGWRKKKNGEVLDEPADGNDHLMDALRYAITDLHKPRFDF